MASEPVYGMATSFNLPNGVPVDPETGRLPEPEPEPDEEA